MGVLSVLRQSPGRLMSSRCFHTGQQLQGGGGPRTMHITPSRWQWHKFKDMMHFYVMLGVIPLGLITLYNNIFIGPSRLVPIPEGYVPKEYEYEQHPITRFIATYMMRSYQELYERKLHIVYIEQEMKQMRLLESKIKKIIKEREDVQGYTFRPILTKYHKTIREEYENLPNTFGTTKGGN